MLAFRLFLFFMKYGIYINQKAIIDNGWNIKANHCAVLDSIVSIINSGSLCRFTDSTGDWFWISNSTILCAIPMFEIADRRLRQLIKDLTEIDLLETNPNNEQYGRCYIRIGKAYKKYVYFDEEKQPLEKNFQASSETYTPGKKFPGPWKKISRNNNINIIKERKKETEKSNDFLSLSEFLKVLPIDYFILNYKKYLDSREALQCLYEDNIYNKFDYTTWLKHLDTKIKLHKNEKFIQRIMNLATKQNDIVLDYHLGSGTTCAVAHKMNRQYIGIEQMNYGENDSDKSSG